jgi:hypothetical protein
MIKCVIIILVIFLFIEYNKKNTIFNSAMQCKKIESFNESDLVEYELSGQTNSLRYWW